MNVFDVGSRGGGGGLPLTANIGPNIIHDIVSTCRMLLYALILL